MIQIGQITFDRPLVDIWLSYYRRSSNRTFCTLNWWSYRHIFPTTNQFLWLRQWCLSWGNDFWLLSSSSIKSVCYSHSKSKRCYDLHFFLRLIPLTIWFYLSNIRLLWKLSCGFRISGEGLMLIHTNGKIIWKWME